MDDRPSTSSSFACSSIIPDDSPVDEKDMPATDRAIEKLFDGIDAIYFMENGFNAIAHELEKLSVVCSGLEIDELERERFKLKRQMQVVSRKMSALIGKNSLGFNRQVENYENVRTNAEQLLRITRKMRSTIEIGKRKCRFLASVLASNYKKRLCLLVKRELALIATLHDSENRVRQLLQENDIWGFLQVVIGVINAARHFQHYSSVKQISLTLMNFLRSTECQIDGVLAQQTKLFKLERYKLLNSAYNFLGNIESMSVKLINHFKESLCNASRAAVLDLLRTYPNLATEQTADLADLPFESLCRCICLKDLLRSLCKVGSALVEILRIYHAILKFHVDEDKLALQKMIGQNDDTEQYNNSDQQQQFAIFDFQPMVEKGVMQKALIDNAFDVFECAASRSFNCLLEGMDLSAMKFDQFIKIVDLSERFRNFGRQYFGNPSELIEKTLLAQSRTYNEHYLLEKMEEVKMFLESETFTLCPVPVQFTLFDLPEFFFLKEAQQPPKDVHDGVPTAEEATKLSLEAFVGGKSIRFSLLDRTSDDGTEGAEEIFPYAPEQFDESPRHASDSRRFCRNGSSLCSSFDDGARTSVDDVESVDDPSGGPTLNTMPNLCNSALNLLRVIGRLLQMSIVLRSTAELTVESIVALFNCYVYTIFSFFCVDFDAKQQEQMFGTNFVSFRLRHFVQFIESELNRQNCGTPEGEETAAAGVKNLFYHSPSLCHALDKDDPDKLFLLAERIVSVESAMFLAKQMEMLRPFLEALLPKRGGNLSLDSLFRFLPAVFDLGDASFGCVAAKVVAHPSILKQILATDWSTDEIQSQHSAYVDAVVKEYSEFKQKFVRLYAYVHISNELYSAIWSMMLLCTMRTLVQGYADAKKCSIEGRALQLLDAETAKAHRG
uniref:Vps54_N domain-containing protein n=1 Tax=Globodera pallida TaxID=36090 RepID=A0A183BXZ1_GLOPA